jgi:fibronectin-binding autotransporter adhesin
LKPIFYPEHPASIMKTPALPSVTASAKAGALLLLTALPLASLWADSYNWTGVSAGNWSSAANWDPLSGPPSDGDLAFITDPASGMSSIVYDTSASGSLGSLSFTNSAGAAIQTLLILNRDLTLTSGTSVMSASVSGSTVRLQLNGDSSLTIGSGAVFEIGVNSTSEQAYYTAIQTGSGYTGTGTTVAGELKLINGVTGQAGFAIQGPVTVANGGTLTAQGNTAVENPNFRGNFTTEGTNTIRATTVGSSTTTDTKLTFQGAENTFSSGTSFVGLANATTSGYSGTTGLIFNPTSTTPNQSITMGVAQDFAILNNTAKLDATATYVSTAASNGIGSVYLNTTSAGVSGDPTVTTFKLGSNLTYAGNSGKSAFSFGFNELSYITQVIDLNGHTYDHGLYKSFNPQWVTSGGTTGAGTNAVVFANSGASSLAGGNGVFKAAYFNLTGSNIEVGIGSGVILQALRDGQLNDLSHGAGGQSIAADSMFYYSGAGLSALKSDRAIGALTVGSGSSLELSSALTAQGVTTVNSGGMLNLTSASGISGTSAGTYALTTAGLSGSGTVTNEATGASATTVTLNGSDTQTFSGTLADNSASNSVSLVYAGSGTQILSGNNTYRGTTLVSSGTLLIDGDQSLATGAVTVAGTGTLGGAGISGGAVTVQSGGFLTPGSGTTGNLTVASLTLEAGATATFEINGASAGSYDSVTATAGMIDLDGTLALLFGVALADGDSVTLFNGDLTGNFGTISLSGGGYTAGNFTQDGTLWTSMQASQMLTFDAVTGVLSATAVPEPATLGLIMGAAATLVMLRRRRNARTALSR